MDDDRKREVPELKGVMGTRVACQLPTGFFSFVRVWCKRSILDETLHICVVGRIAKGSALAIRFELHPEFHLREIRPLWGCLIFVPIVKRNVGLEAELCDQVWLGTCIYSVEVRQPIFDGCDLDDTDGHATEFLRKYEYLRNGHSVYFLPRPGGRF